MDHIQMNLKQDWLNIVKSEIEHEGLVIPAGMQLDSKIIKYFTYLRKKAPKGPLNVIKSKSFNCEAKYLPAIDEIERIFNTGGDYSPYLSKQVDQFRDDLMFNDWGILHLHLGTELESNGRYIQRTGPLLFVYFNKNNVYFINVFPHAKWTNREILQTIYDNWPDVLDPFIMKGIKDVRPEYTEEQHFRLRKSGINASIPLNDKNGNKIVIMAPGMGIAASGDSVNDVRLYQKISNNFRSIEAQIREGIDSLKADLKSKNIEIPSEFHFGFLGQNETDGMIIKEKNTGLYINFKDKD